jgi:SAM-dependent methyltransferase
MGRMESYTTELYEHWSSGARNSAQAIVPLVVDMVRPQSVVDVGCGLGFWLRMFQDLGVKDVFGIDGDWVELPALKIPKENFKYHDLTKPLSLDRKFDLAVSLEVGEHLPDAASNTLVDTLTKLAPVILFSAAMPYQTGTNHINEQWPEYWAERFRARGYVPIDCIRKRVWEKDIEWWYAQNTLVYCREDMLDNYPALKKELENTFAGQLSLVHPKNYLMKADPKNRPHLPFRELVAEIPGAIYRALEWRIKKVVGG